MKSQSFCNLISEVTFHNFCHALFMINVKPTLKGTIQPHRQQYHLCFLKNNNKYIHRWIYRGIMCYVWKIRALLTQETWHDSILMLFGPVFSQNQRGLAGRYGGNSILQKLATLFCLTMISSMHSLDIQHSSGTSEVIQGERKEC